MPVLFVLRRGTHIASRSDDDIQYEPPFAAHTHTVPLLYASHGLSTGNRDLLEEYLLDHGWVVSPLVYDRMDGVARCSQDEDVADMIGGCFGVMACLVGDGVPRGVPGGYRRQDGDNGANYGSAGG